MKIPGWRRRTNWTGMINGVNNKAGSFFREAACFLLLLHGHQLLLVLLDESARRHLFYFFEMLVEVGNVIVAAFKAGFRYVVPAFQ